MTSDSEDKTFTRNPPQPPTLEARKVDKKELEKIYISLNQAEQDKRWVDQHQDVGYIRKKEEEGCYRYKTINGVITESESKPVLQIKRRYRKNAVQNRMRKFARAFYERGFNYGTRIRLEEFKMWIEDLELAHDKLTIDQYVHRLCIYGYFYAEANGDFTFMADMPGQTTLSVLKTQRARLRRSLHTDHRIKRRSY